MSFFRNGEQEGKTGPTWGLAPIEREDIKKGRRREDVVEPLCTHV
jgi:hypothetical protein